MTDRKKVDEKETETHNTTDCDTEKQLPYAGKEEKNMKWEWNVQDGVEIYKPDVIDESTEETDGFVDPGKHGGKIIMLKNKYFYRTG